MTIDGWRSIAKWFGASGKTAWRPKEIRLVLTYSGGEYIVSHSDRCGVFHGSTGSTPDLALRDLLRTLRAVADAAEEAEAERYSLFYDDPQYTIPEWDR